MIVRTFADLEQWFRDLLARLEVEAMRQCWRTHHVATIRKVRNRLANISTRCAGLVTDGADGERPAVRGASRTGRCTCWTWRTSRRMRRT
ncbi:MAG: hypothetical protein U5K74_05700 [Gemmatimonadaceae bacterium]|nr:hypothetical protein [Gemmatimonadaceae bacterium]